LAASPDLVVAHQLRGETLLILGRVAEAAAALDRFLAHGQPSVLASRARGLCRAKLGNYPGAVEDYTRALEIEQGEGKPADPVTLAYRGWAYLILEAPKLALRDFDEALRLGGSNQADCHAGRGYARVLLNQWQAAVTDAEAVRKEGKLPARTLYNTARIYAQAAARVQRDPEQQNRRGQELRWEYEAQALQLLHSACEKTPALQRSAFWKEYVEADPALQPLSRTAGFVQLRGRFAGPVE
jgi:tetratricopeptide (TPR) repeat protein